MYIKSLYLVQKYINFFLCKMSPSFTYEITFNNKLFYRQELQVFDQREDKEVFLIGFATLRQRNNL